MFTHLAGNMCEHLVVVIQPDAKHRAGQDSGNRPLDLDMFLVAHQPG